MGLCLGLVLLSRVLLAAVQYGQVCRCPTRLGKGLRLLVWAELFCIAVTLRAVWIQDATGFPVVHTVYLIIVLAQGVGALGRRGVWQDFRRNGFLPNFSRPAAGAFVWLFLLGGLATAIEPSWRRLADQVVLDSKLETILYNVLPAWIGGTVSLWVGIVLSGGLRVCGALKRRLAAAPIREALVLFAALFWAPALLSILLVSALLQAVAWQAAALNLNWAGLQLGLLLSVSGGVLLALAFNRMVPHLPQVRAAGPFGAVCLGLGAVLVWPLTVLFSAVNADTMRLRLLIGVIWAACLLAGGLVLFGNLFNPWFTTFSYLKGAVILLLCLVAAGVAGLLGASRAVSTPHAKPSGLRSGFLIGLALLLGVGPFWVLEAYPEVKAVLLQYHELVRVDAALARLALNNVGLGRWVHLGQKPMSNGMPDPWPLPWHLRKTHASLLPQDFNLLVIVVDALRGDAFSSAGYPRRTTPFLDRWALAETISFRRAYSQGGGSFAGFPFLVGGRSRFDLYGPRLFRRNLYFKLAQAEKIDQVWVTGRFGPRAIFPPGFPVKILNVNRPVSDRRTPSADEAFAALDRAVDGLKSGERFLCFLHLMDVHNDLWKKAQGVDFGNRPRDIYDNNLSYLDGACQRFFQRLKDKGLYNRTVILLTSDHGEQFWEHGANLHGHTLYEEEIRVPLILLTHSLVRRFEDVPVLNSDMAPTLVDLAGYAVDPPYADAHMGMSLRPLILNQARRIYLHRTVAGRASFNRRYLWYRDWRWKLIFFPELDVLQLYNVAQDPRERRNLLQEDPDLAAEMESDLLDYLRQVEGRTYLPVISRRAR